MVIGSVLTGRTIPTEEKVPMAVNVVSERCRTLYKSSASSAGVLGIRWHVSSIKRILGTVSLYQIEFCRFVFKLDHLTELKTLDLSYNDVETLDKEFLDQLSSLFIKHRLHEVYLTGTSMDCIQERFSKLVKKECVNCDELIS